ncbi:hypothetical protein SK128_012582, partial [Halocaridina rubra]
CKALPSPLPNQCIVTTRSWMRYPDCCPEIYCSPSPILNENIDHLKNHRSSERYESQGHLYPSANKGNLHSHRNIFKQDGISEFTTPFTPQFMTTEIIYGSGLSQPLTPTSDIDKDMFLEQDFNDLGDPYSPDFESPGNTLNGWSNSDWKEEANTEIPYQFKEDSLDTTTSGHEKIPYIVTYSTTPDFSDSSAEYSTSRPFYHHFNHKEQVQTSPLPFLKDVYDVNPVTVSSLPNTPNVDGGTTKNEESSTHRFSSATVESTTQGAYVNPTTYSPSTRVNNRLRPTIPFRRRPTRYPISWRSTTPGQEWATKTMTDSTTPMLKDPKVPTSTLKYERPVPVNVHTTTSKTLQFASTTEEPSEKFTKIERTISKVKKIITQRNATATPDVSRETTPSSYEFASPVLDPSKHDIVEFIHTPLDPSALIPGHETYVKLKAESEREYVSKNKSNIDHVRKMRSASSEQSDDVMPEKTERRGRPVFYIPWRNETENVILDLKASEEFPENNSLPLTKGKETTSNFQTLVNVTEEKQEIANGNEESKASLELVNLKSIEIRNSSDILNSSIGVSSFENNALINQNEQNLETREEHINVSNSVPKAETSETLQIDQMSKSKNVSEILESPIQSNRNETSTSMPFITHATVSSTTSYPDRKLVNNETVSRNAEVTVSKQSGSQANVTFSVHIPPLSKENITSNRNGRRMFDNRRNLHMRNRLQQSNPNVPRGRVRYTEASNVETVSTPKSQVPGDISLTSAPSYRERWNVRQNYTQGRTRAHVPVLNYERRNENDSSESLINYSKNQVNNFPIKQVTTEIHSVTKPPNTTISRHENLQGTKTNPYIIDSTNDQIRKHSSTHYVKQEMRNEFIPRRHPVGQSSKPSSFDWSNFSSSLNSTLAVQNVKDSYRELEVYSSFHSSPYAVPSQPGSTVPGDSKTKPLDYKSLKDPTSTNIRSEDSRPYYHEYQMRYSKGSPDSSNISSKSVHDSKPQYDKWFTNIFGESKSQGIKSVPHTDDDTQHAIGTELNHKLSHNENRYIGNQYPPRYTENSSNYATYVPKQQNSFIPHRKSATNLQNRNKGNFLPRIKSNILPSALKPNPVVHAKNNNSPKTSLHPPLTNPPTHSARAPPPALLDKVTRISTLFQNPRVRPVSRNILTTKLPNSSHSDVSTVSPLPLQVYNVTSEIPKILGNQNRTQRPATIKLVSVKLINATSNSYHPKASNVANSAVVQSPVSESELLRNRNTRRRLSWKGSGKNPRMSPKNVTATTTAPLGNLGIGPILPNTATVTKSPSIKLPVRNRLTNVNHPVRTLRQRNHARTLDFGDDLQLYESNTKTANNIPSTQRSKSYIDNTYTKAIKDTTNLPSSNPNTFKIISPTHGESRPVNARQREENNSNSKALAPNSSSPTIRQSFDSTSTHSFTSRGNTPSKVVPSSASPTIRQSFDSPLTHSFTSRGSTPSKVVPSSASPTVRQSFNSPSTHSFTSRGSTPSKVVPSFSSPTIRQSFDSPSTHSFTSRGSTSSKVVYGDNTSVKTAPVTYSEPNSPRASAQDLAANDHSLIYADMWEPQRRS